MGELIKAILKLIPFVSFFEKMGLSEGASVGLSVLVVAILLWGMRSLFKYLINHYKNSKAARVLDPWITKGQVKGFRENYIPTQFQNQSPTREEEPGFTFKYVSRNPLIPHFMKNAFDEKKEGNKFYLVLADSGMGKTTFLINLYVKYHSFFNFRRKFKMRFFPLGRNGVLERIKEIKLEEAKDTILLLDAFDEDKKLLNLDETEGLTDDERFRKRMDEVIDAVQDFREVIITSRTQYFPGQEDKAYELKIPRYDGTGFHTLAKIYLSPFSKREIKRYLNKKYGILKFWNLGKKRKARNIVFNSPKLMVRPMLLSYIDLLVDSKQNFKNTYEIYETLVEKWIEREAKKRKHESRSREAFMHDLHRYSQLVALEIYKERKTSSMFSLKKEKAIHAARANNIELEDYVITGQSLLTRDAEGNWKFAHKSILEYFIAKHAIENSAFAAEIDFAGMDMAEKFYREINPFDMVPVRGGTFKMGSEDKEAKDYEKPVHEVTLDDFYIGKYEVTVKEFETFIKATNYKTDADKGGWSYIWTGSDWKKKKGVNWQCDVNGNKRQENEYNHPVIHVSWRDVIAYCKWLSENTGKNYRLPTEAEWEFAAIGGHRAPKNEDDIHYAAFKYAGSDNLDEVGWYNGNSEGKTHPIGKKKPNQLGIYDMSGNVYEWCQDKWHENYEEAPTDGSAWESGNSPRRVIRGGSWYRSAERCRVAYRRDGPGHRNGLIGFRLVCVP